MNPRTRKSPAPWPASAMTMLFLSVVVGGCGGPTSPSDTVRSTVSSPPRTADATQTAGLCESWVESDTAGTELLRLDYKTASPEQIEFAIKKFWIEQEPILVFLEQQAPDEIRPDVATLLRLARQGRISGDPVALLSPELKRADDNIDSFMLQRCGFIQLQVVATDHSYGGLPTTIGPVTVAMILRNEGEDAHQVLISRVPDDKTSTPLSEISQALIREDRSYTTPLAVTAADPGDSSTVFIRLRPGRYVLFDAYPEGTVDRMTLGNGPPHFALGMITELIVE